MKIMLVAGARPNFMKIASIVDALNAHNRSNDRPVEFLLVHTGQHYDERMSHVFFKDLGLPPPDVDLEVGSSSHAGQTAEIMKRFEPVLLKERPDVMLVVGDVNSTIACSLVASKINYPESDRPAARTRPLIAHVEAGLRSFDRSMPEEINRILTDALSDFLFITEKSAEENLIKEGIPKKKIHFVGNTMVDTLLKHRERAQKSDILSRLGLERSPADGGASSGGPSRKSKDEKGKCDYAILTLHRPSNVDDRKTFREILEALSVLGKELPILFPIHPRTMSRIKEFGFEKQVSWMAPNEKIEMGRPGIYCMEPLGYLDFLCLTSNAKIIFTDSGGIQEESTVLGVPCVTLRKNTERPATLTNGTNVLAGTSKEAIIRSARRQIKPRAKSREPRFWDGRAGERVIRILIQKIAGHR